MLKYARYGGIYFTGKGVVFMGLAALGATALPPVLLAGLSVTWFAFGVMLFAGVRRFAQAAAPAKAEPTPAGHKPQVTQRRAEAA
jgi:hypothetical protein